MADYVKFEVPADLRTKQAALLEKARKTGKIRVGANEATKGAERGTAKLIVIAEDVSPPEIVMHLPIICKEKGIPVSYVATKIDLGNQVGIKVGTAAIAVIDAGDAKKDFEDLAKKLQDLAK